MSGGYLKDEGLGPLEHQVVVFTFKGEISGGEDMYVDGQVEGSVQLLGNSLTIGPNGRVHASVAAKNVTVGGSLEGNIKASERTEMRKSAVVNGDVQTRRIAIEEGAFFKGKLEILTDSKSPASGHGASAASASAPSPAPGTAEQRK